MDKVFFSEITRNKTHQNDLKDLCKVDPATPIVNKTVINLDCDFNPQNDKIYIPKKKSKLKVKTVRDIRNQFEKDVLFDLPSYLERQQNLLLRKIKDGSSRNEQTKLIAKNILNSEEPISRTAWQMLLNINPEGHAHTAQYILCDGKSIRINGSRGGRNKFISNLDSSKVIKPLKNNSQKKSFFKNKCLLRNSLSVDFKPGPLSRKTQLDNSYQKYNVGDIELVNLPKPGLEVQPSHGRILDPMISNLINNFRDVNGCISEKWAEFAVSVLENKNTSNHSNDSPLTFDLNYKCNQRRILMRRDRDTVGEIAKTKNIPDMMEICTTDEFDVIPEVRVMMNKILDAVEISVNQDNMYTSDDEPREECEKNSLNSSGNNNVKDRTKKRYCELDRLDVTVIRLPENEHNNLSACKNSFCLLGCICDSLQSVMHLKGHCSRNDCMFECKCDLTRYSISDYDGECSELLPGLINLEKEINHKLAKEEQKFHQTVIVTGNQSILLKAKRRNWKSSKKYADFYSQMSLKSDLKLNPVLSILVNKIDCKNIEPWCIVHHLYKCFCKGKFTDPVKTEKMLNENEKCPIIIDKESPVETSVSIDNDSQEKPRPRLRRDKYAERNSSVVVLDSEHDMEDSCSNDSNHIERFKPSSRLNVNIETGIDLDSYYNSCSRARPYAGRKFSLGYYLNANHNIQNMEINDSNLRKRLEHLVGMSVNKQDQYNIFEKNITSDKITSRHSERAERLKRRREKASGKDENESGKDENECGKDENAAIEPNSKEIVGADPMDISVNQSSLENSTESCDLEMLQTSDDKRITNKPQLVAWLESSYQQYKKRADKGIVKNTLEPPKKGKVCLYPWDFILSRYSERKNLFLISKNKPFRIFMAVDVKNPQFEHCINIDEIRFADLYKYPVTVKNLLTNTSGLKDNFCILFGFAHCWELIGSVMKINDSKDNTNSDIEQTLSDEALENISYPIEEASHKFTHILEESVSEAASSSKSNESICESKSPSKNPVSESSKWFVMTIENDFSEIQFYNKGFFVKHESIMKALNVAKVSGKTVRLSSQKCADKANNPQFGIYAVAIPNASEDCVFVGPYETDESLGIETVKLVSQIKRLKEKTRGVWIFTNKVDNLKVIDNPLSFMPSQDVQKNKMLPLDKVTTEDNNKICDPETQTTVHNIPEMPVIVTSEKPTTNNQNTKKVKPIKIRKPFGFCRISSSKSLLLSNHNQSQCEGITIKNMLSQPISISSKLPSELPSVSSMPILILNEDQTSVQNLPVVPSELTSEIQPSVSSVPILILNPDQTSVQNPPVECEQKLKKPVAEVAPQIKIAAVYSEAVEKSTENKKPERTMLILKPEEINKRHLEKSITKPEDPSTSGIPESIETMDIEDYLESSAICTAPVDETLIISDEEAESPIREVWLTCTNVDNFGLIPAKMNEEGQISFQFPGFKPSEFYVKEKALEKIQQVLSRKVYIPSNLNLEWDVIESRDKIENFNILKTEDLSTDLVLTKQGLRHKTLVFKTSNDLKTYGRKKSKQQTSSTPTPDEQTEELTNELITISKKSLEVALIKTIFGASEEDRQEYTNTLENIMQENQDSSLPASELF